MFQQNYDGKWLYSKLRHGQDFRIIMRLYRHDMPINNEGLVGFLCEIIDLFGRTENKQYVLEKTKKLISDHELPLVLEDLPFNERRFKILIIKKCQQEQNTQ